MADWRHNCDAKMVVGRKAGKRCISNASMTIAVRPASGDPMKSKQIRVCGAHLIRYAARGLIVSRPWRAEDDERVGKRWRP